jgi:hypothetical protein
VQAHFFGFATVIDTAKNADAVGEETLLQPLGGLGDGIGTTQVDQPVVRSASHSLFSSATADAQEGYKVMEFSSVIRDP